MIGKARGAHAVVAFFSQDDYSASIACTTPQLRGELGEGTVIRDIGMVLKGCSPVIDAECGRVVKVFTSEDFASKVSVHHNMGVAPCGRLS